MSCKYAEDSDFILAYVCNQLPEDKQSEFEEHYLGCQSCAKDVLYFEKTRLLMKEHGATLFEGAHDSKRFPILAPVHAVGDFLEELTVGRWISEHGAAIAGGLAIILVAVFGTLSGINYNAKDGNEVLLGLAGSGIIPDSNCDLSHVDWPQGLIVTAPTQDRQQLMDAYQTYQIEKNYQDAVLKLSPLLESNSVSPQTSLFHAFALLKTDEIPKSMEVLQAYLHDYPDDMLAKWLLAQALILSSQKDQAVQYLTEIAEDSDSEYASTAATQLSKIR